ncbi:MAG: Nif3-like dinuclear metal center hexameric protein, partial [Muribaculaceae bacterium]|nr:Nif3-like dinuclear metal center hexameric protein [Muribaculaceae bacterium]
MKLSHIIAAIEEYAPRSLQESWDNSGLQIGLPESSDGECTGVLLCLDVTPDIIAQAVAKGCNLVVSHHPLIFKGLKSISEAGGPVQRAVAAAIRSGVAVYSSHTALDSTRGGVSYEMARLLGAEVLRVLAPSDIHAATVSVTCPRSVAEEVRLALLDGKAPSCDYFDIDSESIGSAPAADDEVPGISITHEPLCRIEAPAADSSTVAATVAALRSMSCASDLRIDIRPVDNRDMTLGLGVVAQFDTSVKGSELTERIRAAFSPGCIKASRGYSPDMVIRRIALCGGSGGEFTGRAAASGAQAYITADVRYHDFADAADSAMAIFDIGHFESELCARGLFHKLITNRFPDLAVYY